MELEQLIQRVKAGDQAAFSETVSKLQDMAVGYAFSFLGDIQLAQDAAQEAFIDAYYKISQLTENKAFPKWLKTIVFKHCDRIRRKNNNLVIPFESDEYQDTVSISPIESVTGKELQAAVNHSISQLSLEEREVITLFYLSDHSQKEIAGFLDITVDTVKNRLRSARNKLKDKLFGIAQDYLLSQRPSLSSDFLISIGKKMSNFILPPDSEAERLEHGLVILRKEGWSKMTYSTPLTVETEINTVAGNHARLYFGTKGALIVHWADGGIEFLDPATGYPYRKDILPVLNGDWIKIKWEITESSVRVVINNDLVFTGEGNYQGLSGRVGIGTNNVRLQPLIIKSLKAMERDRDAASLTRVNYNTGVIHERLKAGGFNSSLIGCIKRCADFLDISCSTEWLFGITGQAFLITVDDSIKGTGQDRSYWISDRVRDLARNAGILINGAFGNSNSNPLLKEHAWSLAKWALQKGFPCYAWQIELDGEYGVIYGFDDKGYLIKGWHGAHGPIAWDKLGSQDTNGNRLSEDIELCWVETTDKSDDIHSIREGLMFALEHANNPPEQYRKQGLKTGLAAYDEWMTSLREGVATAFGTCYHASVWKECRFHAIKFLTNEMSGRIDDNAISLVTEATEYYKLVFDQLNIIYSDLFPWIQPREAVTDKKKIEDTVHCLKIAREAEERGLNTLEKLINKL